MAASILNTQRAINAGILVVRVFVKMRQMIATHIEMASKLNKLEKQFEKYDENFQIVFEAIKQLFDEEEKPKVKIGYIKEEKAPDYIGFWGGLRYPPKEAEMQRLCNQLS